MFKNIATLFTSTLKVSGTKIVSLLFPFFFPLFSLSSPDSLFFLPFPQNKYIVSLPTNTVIHYTHHEACPCELEEIAKYADHGSVRFGDFQSSSGCDRCREAARERAEERRAEEDRRERGSAAWSRKEEEGAADLLVFGEFFASTVSSLCTVQPVP